MTEKQEAFDIANHMLENASLDPDGDISMLARQFLRAREEIDAMREALAPFAPAAELFSRQVPDHVKCGMGFSNISVGDFRRARDALANLAAKGA